MAGGSWNGGGDIPARPSAWCKVNQGWAQAVIVKENGTLNIDDIKSSQKALSIMEKWSCWE